MKISIGSDHGGHGLKETILPRLRSAGHQVIDRGSFDTVAVDYPDIALSVCNDIQKGASEVGILICGTGIGMCNAASRREGIISALCTSEYMARMARRHNDANVLCLGGRVVGDELAWSIVDSFLSTLPDMDERYIRRRKKVTEMGSRDLRTGIRGPG